jgi:hypothetical protein
MEERKRISWCSACGKEIWSGQAFDLISFRAGAAREIHAEHKNTAECIKDAK